MGDLSLNFGLCICGEWESQPQVHPKCPECGRSWLTDIDQVAVRLGLLYRIQQQIRIENQTLRSLPGSQAEQII